MCTWDPALKTPKDTAWIRLAVLLLCEIKTSVHLCPWAQPMLEGIHLGLWSRTPHSVQRGLC
jgi:hypothetical protein